MIHFFLLIFALLLGLLIFFSTTPIHAILFLILAIVNSAFILFYFNIEFLGLVLIIIYVGAVAILFLFIVMMLKIKINFTPSSTFFPLYFFIVSFCITQFFLFFKDIYTSYNFLPTTTHLSTFDFFSNLEILGQVLFNSFLIPFLLAGFILLVAMLISIVLTIQYSSHTKVSETVYAQLSRTSSNFLTFITFKKSNKN
ncbi:MAG: hypothetical protein RLZZ414_38 [Bacteroidota bacterium]|jgi:NADH-quinone oxidoreductase subunit J